MDDTLPIRVRLASGFLLVVLALGCQPTTPDPPVVRLAPPPPARPGQVVIDLDAAGLLRADGWSVAENDLPELIAQRHATSVIIRGGNAAKFGDALRIQSELRAAGVADVTIASAGG